MVSERAEKWRYEKIEEMTEKGTSKNKIQRVSQYDSYLAKTVAQINEATSKVTTDCSKDTIKDIVKLAADFWIEIGRQRCRVIVSLPESTGNLLGVRKRETSTIELIVKPRLLRYGTLTGLDLDEPPVVVAGCDSEQLRVQLRRSRS